MEDVVGLYLDPPDKALVFSVDERSQIQALARTRRSLPIKKGRVGTTTYDYTRNGTTILLAALSRTLPVSADHDGARAWPNQRKRGGNFDSSYG